MTPEWYFEAGKSYADKFVRLLRAKEIDLADTIEEVYKYHTKNLRELGLNEEADALQKGFKGHVVFE